MTLPVIFHYSKGEWTKTAALHILSPGRSSHAISVQCWAEKAMLKGPLACDGLPKVSTVVTLPHSNLESKALESPLYFESQRTLSFTSSLLKCLQQRRQGQELGTLSRSCLRPTYLGCHLVSSRVSSNKKLDSGVELVSNPSIPKLGCGYPSQWLHF